MDSLFLSRSHSFSFTTRQHLSHTRCISLTRSCLARSFSLSHSLFLFISLPHLLSRSLGLPPPPPFTPSLSFLVSRVHSLSLCLSFITLLPSLTLTRCLSDSLYLSHLHCLSRVSLTRLVSLESRSFLSLHPLSVSHAFSLSLTRSLSLSLSVCVCIDHSLPVASLIQLL